MHMRMQWKHDNGGPTPFCALCSKEAWGHSHVYSNMHLNKVLTQPYNWSGEWTSPPTPEDAGVQNLRTHGQVSDTLPKQQGGIPDWSVKAYMPPWGADNQAHFVSNDNTADPHCHTVVTTPMAEQPAPLPPLMVSVPSEHIHLATQPQQAPISSDLDDLNQYLKKLQDCFKNVQKDVVELGHEQDFHTEIILEMRLIMDEYQKKCEVST